MIDGTKTIQRKKKEKETEPFWRAIFGTTSSLQNVTQTPEQMAMQLFFRSFLNKCMQLEQQ
jgi:hypothetical protein